MNFTSNINQHEKIIAIRNVHKFFEKHKLIENADVMESRFDQQIIKLSQLIELQKSFSKSNEVSQEIIQHVRNVFRRKVEKNYKLLVEELIKLH